MEKKKKTGITLAIVLPLGALMLIAAALAAVLILRKPNVGANGDVPVSAQAVLREDVQMPSAPKEVQRRYERLEVDNGVYTLVYRDELPDFFQGLEKGDIFCIEPDAKARQPFFAAGFSGIVVNKAVIGDEAGISFAVPDVTELFTDLDISLGGDGSKIDSVLFIPADESENAGLPDLSSDYALMATSPAALAIIKEMETDFDLKLGKNRVSLLEDYAYICEELKIDTETEVELGSFELALDSKVILEDLAIKSDIAYHTDESTGQVVLDNYDIGVISKHRLDMTVEPSLSAGLDDIGGGFNIIDFKDATDAEDGKVVLGTFLVGLSVPFLESDTNNVSYLSLGIAIQLTVTAEGEISVECRYKQNGYSRIEVGSDGSMIEEIRGYDYPNPVITGDVPTAEQLASAPDVECRAEGELNIHAGLGVDVGLCIFGTVPVKISNNIVDVQYNRSGLLFDTASGYDVTDKTDTYQNGYMLDPFAEFFKIGMTSFFRMNIGFESDLDVLNIGSFDIGAEVQLFNKVFYQYPDPVGFSRAECDFGGVQLGQSYTRDEITETFKQFQKDTNQYSIIGSIKDSAVNAAIGGFMEGLDLAMLTADLGISMDEIAGNMDVAVFPSGAIYVMDGAGTVICQVIAGEGIVNRSGLSCGMNTVKTEILYSVPQQQESMHIDLGEYGEYLGAMLGISEGELTAYGYESVDSSDVMLLLYSDGALKLIITADSAVIDAGF